MGGGYVGGGEVPNLAKKGCGYARLVGEVSAWQVATAYRGSAPSGDVTAVQSVRVRAPSVRWCCAVVSAACVCVRACVRVRRAVGLRCMGKRRGIML